jgi:membrane associated rhomboid family serine protease
MMAGINNFAHAGGFLGGYLAAMALGHNDHKRKQSAHQLAATACILLTALSFVLALWTGLVG